VTPTPIALSMSLCDYVIIEEGTGKASLIGCVSSLVAPNFPSPPRDFFIAVDLTGGRGRGRVSVKITRPDTDDWIWQTQADVYFRDGLFVVRYIARVMDCALPVPGRYAVVLSVDGEFVGQRTLEVTLGGGYS
jgi:hypothetical protein